MGDVDQRFAGMTVPDITAEGGPPQPAVEAPRQFTGAVPEITAVEAPAAVPSGGPLPEDPHQTILSLSSDPAQADAKLQTSKMLGDWLKMHPLDVHQHFDAISQAMWGDQAKGQPPATIFQKARNMFDGLRIQGELDDLSGKQFLGDATPETEQRVKDLQAQQKSLGPTMGWLPKQVAGMAYQLGYQGWHASEAVVGAALAVVGDGALHGVLGMSNPHFLDFAEGESSKVFGSLVGGTYRSLIDRGVDPTHARIFAAGLGALQVGLMAIPIGGEAADALLNAGAEGTLRATLKGSVDDAAKTVLGRFLGMEAGSEATAGAFGKQALFAIGMSSANAVLPEAATAMSNRFAGTKVPLRPAGEVAGEAAQGAVAQFIAGAGMVGAHEALRSMVQTRVETAVQDAVDRETRRMEEEKAQAAKAGITGNVPEAEAAGATPVKIGDILDEQTPEGKAKAPEEQLKYYENLDREVKSAEGSADYVKGNKELERANITIEDLQARLKALPGEIKNREATREGVNTMVGNLRSLDTSGLANDAVVSELKKAVAENQGKPLFTDYQGRLDRAVAQNDLRKAIEGLRDQFSFGRRMSEETLSGALDLKKAIEDGTAPMEISDRELRMLGDIGKKNIRSLSPEELTVLHDNVMAAKHTAALANKVVVRGQLQDKEIARKDMQAEMGQTEMDNRATETELESKGVLSKLKGAVTWVKEKPGVALHSYQSMVTKIFGGERTTGYDILGRRMDEAGDVAAAIKQRSNDILEEWAQEHKGLGNEAWFSERGKVSIKYKTADEQILEANTEARFEGHELTKELTRAQRITIAGILTQKNGLESLVNRFKLSDESNLPVAKGGRRGLFHDGTPEEFFKAVQDSLSPEEKSYLDAVVKMGKEHGEKMGPAYMRLNGKPWPGLEGYFRLDRIRGSDFLQDAVNGRIAENQSILPGNWDGRQFTASVDKSHTIERVDSKAGLWVRDIRDVVKDQIDFASNYIGYAERARDAAKMLFDKETVESIRNIHGQTAVDNLQNALRRIIGYRAPENWMEKLAVRFKNRGILGALGFNLGNTALNRALVVRASAYGVPTRDLAVGTAHMLSNPKGVRGWWYEHSAYFRELKEQGTMPEFAQASRGSTKVGRAMKGAAMAPEKLAFGGAAINEAEGAKVSILRQMQEGHLDDLPATATGLTDQTIPQGKGSEVAREAYAVKYGEFIAKRSHAGPREMYQSFLSSDYGVLGKIAGTLYSEKSALYQMGTRILNSGGPKVGAKFTRFLVVGILGEALIAAGIRHGIQAGKNWLEEEITGKKSQPNKPFLQRCAEELFSAAAGNFPGGSGAAYTVEKILESKRGNTSDVAGQFNAGGVVTQPITQIFQIISATRDYAAAKPGRAQTAATWRMVKAWAAMSSYFTGIHASTTNYGVDVLKGMK
jgi:hypothetical protein